MGVNPRTRHLLSSLLLIMLPLAVAASGADGAGNSPDGATPPGQNDGGNVPGSDGGNVPGTDGGNVPGSDGGNVPGTDAGVQPPPGCDDPEATQCNNCIDDDNDGLTDG
jgi:hypothetical protein